MRKLPYFHTIFPPPPFSLPSLAGRLYGVTISREVINQLVLVGVNGDVVSEEKIARVLVGIVVGLAEYDDEETTMMLSHPQANSVAASATGDPGGGAQP
jgi:hypothetical protein